MKPKVIVTIGNFATERILGKKGITQLRGKIFPLTLHIKSVIEEKKLQKDLGEF